MRRSEEKRCGVLYRRQERKEKVKKEKNGREKEIGESGVDCSLNYMLYYKNTVHLYMFVRVSKYIRCTQVSMCVCVYFLFCVDLRDLQM